MALCQICNEEGHDRRTLRVQYLYDLSEISGKLTKEDVIIRFANGEEAKSTFWTIETCKNCRGIFLGALRHWTSGCVTQNDSDPDRNIPVRIDGRTVLMTTEEWEAHTAASGHVRVLRSY